MRTIDRIYINGQFVTPSGTESFDLHNPATEETIGTVRLADRTDARAAVAAAKEAFPAMARTTKAERIAMLRRLRDCVVANEASMVAAMSEEYGSPPEFTRFSVRNPADGFSAMAQVLETFDFETRIGNAAVTLLPLGVVGAITPWNANFGYICNKLAATIAAGATLVIKPSEMSAIQTDVITRALHQADIPAGVLNVVTGLGPVVGAEISTHPDVAKVLFTGSTVTGRAVLHAAADTMKRVTLELGGKGPTLLLDDADLDKAIPLALATGFMNSGQACVAGTRILVPSHRLADVQAALTSAVRAFKVGPASDPDSRIGPMVSRQQWDRVQSYIRLGMEEGATLLTGGPGRPEGMERGWFVRPTIFVDVRNDMRIAREEIFGPVLCVIPYRNDAEAVAIANDTSYGLQSYVISSDPERARQIAGSLQAGRVVINGAPHEPLAPFGGFKQSGIGRELGHFGLEALLEPRAVLSSAPGGLRR